MDVKSQISVADTACTPAIAVKIEEKETEEVLRGLISDEDESKVHQAVEVKEDAPKSLLTALPGVLQSMSNIVDVSAGPGGSALPPQPAIQQYHGQYNPMLYGMLSYNSVNVSLQPQQAQQVYGYQPQTVERYPQLAPTAQSSNQVGVDEPASKSGSSFNKTQPVQPRVKRVTHQEQYLQQVQQNVLHHQAAMVYAQQAMMYQRAEQQQSSAGQMQGMYGQMGQMGQMGHMNGQMGQMGQMYGQDGQVGQMGSMAPMRQMGVMGMNTNEQYVQIQSMMQIQAVRQANAARAEQQAEQKKEEEAFKKEELEFLKSLDGHTNLSSLVNAAAVADNEEGMNGGRALMFSSKSMKIEPSTSYMGSIANAPSPAPPPAPTMPMTFVNSGYFMPNTGANYDNIPPVPVVIAEDRMKTKICRMDLCNNAAARRTPYCKAHTGARKCEYPNCAKCAQGRTRFCIAHGGGRRCTFPGCNKGARDRFFCAGHGGGKRCEVVGCKRSAVGGCVRCTGHGGGKRCQAEGCTKSAQSCTPYCVKHGGGKKCVVPNCTKVARGRTIMCMSHNGTRMKIERGEKITGAQAQVSKQIREILKSQPVIKPLRIAVPSKPAPSAPAMTMLPIVTMQGMHVPGMPPPPMQNIKTMPPSRTNPHNMQGDKF